MNATSVLELLRATGLEVVADCGDLVIIATGRPVPNDLKELAFANESQVLADLAEEATLACYCPRCRKPEDTPRRAGRRRCRRCGKVWGQASHVHVVAMGRRYQLTDDDGKPMYAGFISQEQALGFAGVCGLKIAQ